MDSQRLEACDAEETMSVSDAARHLSLSPRTIRRIAEELHAVRVDGHWRLRVCDLEEWIVRSRSVGQMPAEPVIYPGCEMSLHPYLDIQNVFLDAPQADADQLIRTAFRRARIVLAEGPGPAGEETANERICRSVLEREGLSSTAFHPDVAYPHPKDAGRRLLGANQIVVIRALNPVDFRDAYGHRPRIAFILLTQTISVQLLWEARLSYLVHKEELVRRVLEARSAEDIYEMFAGTRDESGKNASKDAKGQDKTMANPFIQPQPPKSTPPNQPVQPQKPANPAPPNPPSTAKPATSQPQQKPGQPSPPKR
jgi:mannitol/fructose-specific phosphotransferase system IIA component (Ntr-type)